MYLFSHYYVNFVVMIIILVLLLQDYWYLSPTYYVFQCPNTISLHTLTIVSVCHFVRSMADRSGIHFFKASS